MSQKSILQRIRDMKKSLDVQTPPLSVVDSDDESFYDAREDLNSTLDVSRSTVYMNATMNLNTTVDLNSTIDLDAVSMNAGTRDRKDGVKRCLEDSFGAPGSKPDSRVALGVNNNRVIIPVEGRMSLRSVLDKVRAGNNASCGTGETSSSAGRGSHPTSNNDKIQTLTHLPQGRHGFSTRSDNNELDNLIKNFMKLKIVTAEQLHKASRESDGMEWRTFTYMLNTPLAQFEEWCQLNRPSQVKASSGVGWISVRHPCGRMKGYKIEDVDLVDRACQIWKNETKDVAGLERVAEKVKITTGKWLVHVDPEEVDQVWSNIALSVINKRFGASVLSAKVSPTPDQTDVMVRDGPVRHVICVYNKKFTDIKEVLEVEKELRRLKIQGKITYKPDIYSILGIYRNNDFGLRPTIYSSFYNSKTRETLFQIIATGKQRKIKHE